MTVNELPRFEWKGIQHLSFTIKALLRSSKTNRNPASKDRQASDQLYYLLDTKMQMETIPVGHALALTVACSQVRHQRHT